MGSIFDRGKLQNGLTSYQLKYSVQDAESGKSRILYKTIQCRDKKEAKIELRKIETEVDKNIHAVPSKLTFESWFSKWSPAQRSKVSLRTWERNNESVKLHALPIIGSKEIQKITAIDIENLYEKMRTPGYRQLRWESAQKSKGTSMRPMPGNSTEGLSELTILKTHRALFQIFKDASRKKVISHNVMLEVDAPIPDRKKIVALDQAEIDAVMDGLKDHRIFAIAAVGFSTGCRLGEIIGLQWKNIDLVKNTIRVDCTVEHTQGHGVRLKPRPKNKSSERTIGIPSALATILRVTEIELKTDLLKAGMAFQKEYLVFPSIAIEPMKPIRPGYVSRAFSETVQKLGFKGLHFHCTRHTHATLLLTAGIPVHAVAQRLGHSTPVVTLTTYAHVLARSEGQAVAVSDSILQSSVAK